MLWSGLRNHGIGWHFRRQHSIPPWVVDFACPAARVIVEADGGQHTECDRDIVREEVLVAAGWLVLRFWNNDVLGYLSGVLATIAAACEKRTRPVTPTLALPAAAGEAASL